MTQFFDPSNMTSQILSCMYEQSKPDSIKGVELKIGYMYQNEIQELLGVGNTAAFSHTHFYNPHYLIHMPI